MSVYVTNKGIQEELEMVGFAVPRAYLALGLKNQATSFLDLHTLAMDDRKVFKCAI